MWETPQSGFQLSGWKSEKERQILFPGSKRPLGVLREGGARVSERARAARRTLLRAAQKSGASRRARGTRQQRQQQEQQAHIIAIEGGLKGYCGGKTTFPW